MKNIRSKIETSKEIIKAVDSNNSTMVLGWTEILDSYLDKFTGYSGKKAFNRYIKSMGDNLEKLMKG